MNTQTQDQSPIWASYEDFCTLDATRHPEHDVVAELEVENTTPTMIGDWQGHHHVRLEGLNTNCDGQSCHIPTLLTAKPIIGKMRWLLKRLIILAGLADDLEQAEKEAIKIQVTDPSKDKTYRMGLVEFLFGKIGQSSKDISWTAAYTIQVVPTLHPRTLSEIAYVSLMDKGCYDRINMRYKLITLGKEEEKKELLPLKPRTIRALIYVRRRQPVEKENDDLPWHLFDKLVVLLLVSVLELFGLGKASSRGFGRFTVSIKEMVFGLEHDLKDRYVLLLKEANNEDEIVNSISNLIHNTLDTIRKIKNNIERTSFGENCWFYSEGDIGSLIKVYDADTLLSKIEMGNNRYFHNEDKIITDLLNEDQQAETYPLSLIELASRTTQKNKLIQCIGNNEKTICMVWALGFPRLYSNMYEPGINIKEEINVIQYPPKNKLNLIKEEHETKGIVTMSSHIILFPLKNVLGKWFLVVMWLPLLKADIVHVLNKGNELGRFYDNIKRKGLILRVRMDSRLMLKYYIKELYERHICTIVNNRHLENVLTIFSRQIQCQDHVTRVAYDPDILWLKANTDSLLAVFHVITNILKGDNCAE